MDANVDDFPDDRREFHLQRYRFAVPYCHNKRVLDGACGTGYGSALIGEVAEHVEGIDCCGDTVAYATERYHMPNVHFQKQHVELTPFESGSFDVVVSFETVEHTLCPKSHIWEIARLLKPGSGTALMSVPNRWGLTPYHFFDFDHQLLDQFVSSCFENVTWYYHNSDSRPENSEARGIGPLEDVDVAQAECILAVCEGPRSEGEQVNRLESAMEEIYASAFQRHHEYLAMVRRERKRPLNRLRRLAHKCWPIGRA
jgi:SAM-dependent methyltransferase